MTCTVDRMATGKTDNVVEGVIDDVASSAETRRVGGALEVEQRPASDLSGRVDDPPHHSPVFCWAPHVLCCDAVPQDAFRGCSVEGNQQLLKCLPSQRSKFLLSTFFFFLDCVVTGIKILLNDVEF